MMIKKSARTLLAAVTLLAFGAPAAEAAAPEPFSITENIGDHTFTTEGALNPLCPDSGTFTDELHAAGGNASGFNELFRTVYTCTNGNTFSAQKHLRLVNENGLIVNTGGPITLSGGTGDHTKLNGHGVGTSTFNPATGQGTANISGVLQLS